MGLRAETRPQGWIALFLVDVGLSDIHEAPCLERGFPGAGLAAFGLEVDAQIGAVATKYIKGYGIRIAFGLAVIGCMLSIILKLLQGQFPAAKVILGHCATALVLGLVTLMSLYIFIRMVQGACEELAQKKQSQRQ